MEDQQIVDLFFSRSETAIQALSEKYQRLCYGITKNIIPDARDIDECLNDTYLRIWNSIPPERPLCLPAFLARVARNTALDRYAYNTAQKRNSNLAVAYEELEPYLCMSDSQCDTLIEQQHFKEFINRFLRMQSEESRIFFVRKYWYGDSVRDIAADCHVSEEKVKTSLFRTRNKLKSAMLKEEIFL